MKRIICIILAVLLLAGCRTSTVPQAAGEAVTYDWMAGECLISTRRTGLSRSGVHMVCDFEVTDSGIYYIYSPMDEVLAPFILYADHGSDTIIKLCGRPECDHSTYDCDAYFYSAADIMYYEGYLYVLAEYVGYSKLFRMDLDGRNRVEILDMGSQVGAYGYSLVENSWMGNGVVFFLLVKDIGEDGIGQCCNYYYKLDGSMKGPEPINLGDGIYASFNAGESFRCTDWDVDVSQYYIWDPETNTYHYLTDYPGGYGYFDDEIGIYWKDGYVYRLDYETGESEVLFDTGLEGDYWLQCFPDSLVVGAFDDGTHWADPDWEFVDDNKLYIYNWAFELVDVVELDYPHSIDSGKAIIAETAERYILSMNWGALPRYYIEKSELGTGKVKIHEFKFPDMPGETEKYDDQYADF